MCPALLRQHATPHSALNLCNTSVSNISCYVDRGCWCFCCMYGSPLLYRLCLGFLPLLPQTNFDVSIDIRVNNTDTGVSGPVGSNLNYQVTL